MAANSNWARWVFASVVVALKQVATNANLPVLIEHLDDRNKQFQEAPDRAEIRVTGPFVQEQGKDYFRIYVDVNVLLISQYGGTNKHGYDILRYAGLFQETMSAVIGVWNYGDQEGDYDPDDPDSQIFLGCLEPKFGENDMIRVFNLGQTDRTVKQKESVVDCRYVLYLP